MASSRTSLARRSRWFVGSSSRRKFAGETSILARRSGCVRRRTARRAVLKTSSPENMKQPSSERSSTTGDLGCDAGDVVQHLGVAVEHLVLILREVVGEHVVAELDGAGGGLFEVRQHADERRFARAVGADERDAVAAIDGEAHVLEHLLGAAVGRGIVLGEAGDLDDGASAGGGLREGEVDGGFFFRHFDALDLFELLDARLHLLGLGGLVAEAVDEGFELLDALALVFVRVHQLGAALFLLRRRTSRSRRGRRARACSRLP